MLRTEADWFVDLAELENVSAAARRLHLSQPTLSRMLARLERELDTELFDRHGRRLVLNARGQIFLTHCRRARAEFEAARHEIADLIDPVEGTIRLSFLHSFGIRLVPELIGDFRRGARVAFTLTQDAAETVVDHVRAGDADLAIVSPRPTDTDVVWSPLLRQRLGLAVPRDHRLAGRSEVSLVEVSEEPFVTMGQGFGMRRILEELCAEADFRPDITFESSELGTVAGLVGAGLGVAVLPIEDAPQVPTSVSVIPLAGSQTWREIGVIWQRDRPLSPAAARFRDFVVARSQLD
ncbi:LysR family transcriptional regulator [Williamsia sp.]|uniref:LysR family transcriptional regulator n=1 Tax=Williamsia sp. TaxID=1872085 RepID=UPI0025D0003B|nr:LysR family transcriptional regulator [Williamsia sp.]